jgi:predicted ATP-grasp superfamily ATP-dependent carboligase
MADILIILGVSARSAAVSARAAGYRPYSIDLFADLDTCAAGATKRIDSFPAGFRKALAAAPEAPWLYTGGLENHPALVEELAAVRPLLGNDAAVLRSVRDPTRLSRVLASAGLRYPHYLPGGRGKPRIVKPLRSGGGRGVYLASADESQAVPVGWYEQEYLEGTPASALYVAADGICRLIGVSRQLIGPAFGASEPFGYAGSIAPLTLSPRAFEEARRIGSVLAQSFSMRGVFGVDLMVQGDAVWVLEVNPRLTASAEVVKRVTGENLVAVHVAACETGGLDVPSGSRGRSEQTHGKVIVYARSACQAGERFSLLVAQLNGSEEPVLADIPQPGTKFQCGEPIATVLAAGNAEESALSQLRELSNQVLNAVDHD